MTEHFAGKHAEAIRLYRRVLGQDPRDVIACNNLAVLLSETDDTLREAASLARRALKENPESAALQETLDDINDKLRARRKALSGRGRVVR